MGYKKKSNVYLTFLLLIWVLKESNVYATFLKKNMRIEKNLTLFFDI